MKKLPHIEPWILLILSYFGWAIGEDNRRTFRDLDYTDKADMFISALLVYAGFYGYAYLLRNQQLVRIGEASLPKKIGMMVVLVYLLVIGTNMISEKIAYGEFWHPNTLYYTTPIFIVYSLFVIPYLIFTRGQGAEKTRTLLVATGRGKKVVDLAEVIYFVSEHKLTYCVHEGGQRNLVNKNLQELEDVLPADQFFRANRQFIIAKDKIEGYDSGTFQKLEIRWKKTGLTEMPQVMVSKYKALDFKHWLTEKA